MTSKPSGGSADNKRKETTGDSDDDWGFGQKQGLSTETKVGMALVLILLATFAVVVWKKMDDRKIAEGSPIASNTEGDDDDSDRSDDPVEPQSEPTPTPVAQPNENDFTQQQPTPVHSEPTPIRQQPTPVSSSTDWSANDPTNDSSDEWDPDSGPPASRSVVRSTSTPTTSPENDNPFDQQSPPNEFEDDFSPAGTNGVNSQTVPAGYVDDGRAPGSVGNEFEPTDDQFVAKPIDDSAETNGASEFDSAADSGDDENPFGDEVASESPAPQPVPVSQDDNPFAAEVNGSADPQTEGVASVNSEPENIPAGYESEAETDNADGFAAQPEPVATVAQAGPPADDWGAAPPPGGDLPPSGSPTPVEDGRFGGYREALPEEIPGSSDGSASPFDPQPVPSRSVPYDPPENAPAEVTGAIEPFDSAGTSRQDFGPASQTNVGHDPRTRVHVVGRGDSYWTISRKQYGTARYFSALSRYNASRIPDPTRMRPGMKVLIPPVDVLRQRNPDLFTRNASHTNTAGSAPQLPSGFFVDFQGRPMYRVGSKDTLTHIAQRHLGRASRWTEIYSMNRDRLRDPNNLKIGTELRLPYNASRVHVETLPRTYR